MLSNRLTASLGTHAFWGAAVLILIGLAPAHAEPGDGSAGPIGKTNTPTTGTGPVGRTVTMDVDYGHASPAVGPEVVDAPKSSAGCANGRIPQADAQRAVGTMNSVNATIGTGRSWAAWGCADGSWNVGEVTAGPGAAAAALPSPSELAIQASTSVTLTTPPVSINPYWLRPDGRNATLKNAETWFWVDQANWVTHTPRVDAGPVWVEATITPTSIVITPNDGVTDMKTCKGKGTPLPQNPPPLSEPSPTCSVRFLNQTDGTTWPMTVHVVYSVTWTGFDGTNPVSGTLADISTAPVTYPIAVLTAKPVLVDPNGPPATAAPNHGD